MKIFITGASGFVGGAILKELSRDHEIFALSRSIESDKKIKNLSSKVHLIRGDLFTVSAKDLKGIDLIIHCAAFVGPWGTKEEFWKGNVDGTKNLLEIAELAGVKTFLHMGTEAAIYSGIDLLGIDESYPYPKSTPYLYSQTKQAAEKLVLSKNSKNLKTFVLRPRMVWGPGDGAVFPVLKHLVSTGKFQWVNQGKKRTSTSYIGNLTYAVKLAIQKAKGGEVYFITDAEIHTYKEFISAYLSAKGITIQAGSIPAMVAKVAAFLVEGLWSLFQWKSEPPLMRFPTDNMTTDCVLSSEKAKRELGYTPIYSFVSGLEEWRTSKE